MSDQIILAQLQSMPYALKKEVLDFIAYLLSKHKPDLASEPNIKSPKPPKKSFGKYRGSLKTGLPLQEIDLQLQQLRGEWERTIS